MLVTLCVTVTKLLTQGASYLLCVTVTKLLTQGASYLLHHCDRSNLEKTGFAWLTVHQSRKVRAQENETSAHAVFSQETEIKCWSQLTFPLFSVQDSSPWDGAAYN